MYISPPSLLPPPPTTLTHFSVTYPASTPVNPSQTLDPLHDLNPPSDPLPIIIRATDGKSQSKDSKKTTAQKIKLSTIVQPDDLESFFAKYAEVCKTGMQSLKKRDRSKRKKVKGKAASASKK